jgi:hypothetical protein
VAAAMDSLTMLGASHDNDRSPNGWGTSNATAMTSGVAGLIISEFLDLGITSYTNVQVRDILNSTADNVDQYNQGKPWYGLLGNGRVNAYIALSMTNGSPAKPQGLNASCVNSRIKLTWNPNSEPDVEEYDIYRKVISGSFSLAGTASGTEWYDPGNHDCTMPEFPFYYKIKAVDAYGYESVFSDQVVIYAFFKQLESDSRDDHLLPISFALHPAYPNPFNPSTTIEFDLPEASWVRLTIYDVMGREMKRWQTAERPGYKSIVWQGVDANGQLVPTGMYIFRLEAYSLESNDQFTSSGKMVLLK